MIRRRHLQFGLDERTLAKILGVNVSQICYLENNILGPSLTLFARIADVLQLDCARLLLYAHPEAERFVTLQCQCKIQSVEPDHAWQDLSATRRSCSLIQFSISPAQFVDHDIGYRREPQPQLVSADGGAGAIGEHRTGSCPSFNDPLPPAKDRRLRISPRALRRALPEGLRCAP